jgi:hypothetical protein
MPDVAGADYAAILNGVSCTSNRACTAVGYAEGGSSPAQTLTERWNGRRWSIEPTPNPTAVSSELEAVSCTSSTACIAVGHSFKTADVGSAELPLAERWDGTSWSLQTTPDVGAIGALFGVSCTSSTACTAVGDSYTSPEVFSASLAERWDGISWTREPTPNAPTNSVGGTYLHAVSCTSRATCTAVGNDQSNAALAEQRTAGPTNRFTVSDIQTFADGRISFRATVPRAGRIDVLETARDDNLAKTAVFLQPAAGRFVFAREHTSAGGAGSLQVTVVPNQRGTLLVTHHKHPVTLRLWVSYTPAAGSPRTIGFYGLHLPSPCADPEHDSGCDAPN